jgi:transposase
MALSDDLRERVVEAVVLGGLSRNQAASHFKVSVASAVRWVKRFTTTGDISPAPSGGDRRSGRIESHSDYLLGLVRRSPDLTLLEIKERLIANCGEHFAVSVLWRFFDRHGITFKKKRRMPRSNNAQTCKSDAGNGSRGSSILIRRSSFSLTRQELPRISRANTGVAGAGAGCGRPSRTVTIKR